MSADVPVVCICGPSAAGKTTFTADVADRLRQQGRTPLLMACDDYYRSGWTPDPRFGFDTVDAIDGEALSLDLAAARYRQLQRLRTYDMRERRVGCRTVSFPYDVILLEGAYGPQLLVGVVPLALLVYIDAWLPRRLLRRLKRDVIERKRTPQYVIRQMLAEMLPGERQFIHSLQDHADVVIRSPERDVTKVMARIG